MALITVKKEFNAPVQQVFEKLAQHETYNIAFAPIQVERIKDGLDADRVDGVGSVRKLGFGPIGILHEKITTLIPNERIEYKIVKNPLVKHHLGVLQFESLNAEQTLVTYSIELKMRLPFVSKLILAQLKSGIKLGLSKIAKSI
jgi:hypothetical protein